MKAFKLKKLLFVFVLFLFLFPSILKAQKMHTVHIKNMKELQEYFSYDSDRDIIISGHRGGMLPGYPENCIESCEKTLTLLPSFFEIDPRLTKDGKIVLMHDATLDRTTTGKGAVSDYTYEELQQLYLKDRQGNVTSFKIPLLDEMLEWGKDKTVFNFDNKEIPWEVYSEKLKNEWSKYSNIMLSVRSLKEALFYYERGNDNVMFCSEISDMEQFEAYDKSPIPWNRIMAYIRLTVDPEQMEVYNKLRERGVAVMTSIHPTADKVSNNKDRRAAYQRELIAEPDFIETDYPADFVDLPRTRNEIHALQRKVFDRNKK